MYELEAIQFTAFVAAMMAVRDESLVKAGFEMMENNGVVEISKYD